ncbi:HlyD family secretion protein [Acinetobacter sp. Marseille-Q1618]|uniref:HlyD family secretion protein n=1 Tax=Acinetobacter sp. Marseille-Q1618 TaxID=2697502 RepID=UPI001C2D8FDA|nr:biotin/lipoyl-binding protein [Acinetobacter sp. Marseille-Q1618]
MTQEHDPKLDKVTNADSASENPTKESLDLNPQENVPNQADQTRPAPTPDSKSTEPPQSNPAPKKTLLIVLGLIILIALIGLIVFGLWKAYQPKTIDVQGRVETETLHISTKVPSRIEEILVKEGQQVTQGQVLVKLSSPEVEAKKQQAMATLQSALALQSTAERGSQQENIDSLYANWQALKAQEALAQTTYQRGANLFREGVISRQRRDEMHAAAQSSHQMTEAAYQQYARAKRGSTTQQKSSADAQVDIAQAAVKEANALEAETILSAPSNGTVSKIYGKTSELVAMGVPVVSLLETDAQWISLNVREDQYAQVYQAKTLQGFIPALNQTADFKIDSIDAEGEFATIKNTRQTGGYDVRSFKLKLVPAEKIDHLKVGMSVIFKLQELK